MKSLRARVEALEAPEQTQQVDIAVAITAARGNPLPRPTSAENAAMAASPDPRMRAIAAARHRAGLGPDETVEHKSNT
jgi:hypothetical protein